MSLRTRKVALPKERHACPKCGGQVKAAQVGYGYRWTCQSCSRDFGYNLPGPDFLPGWKGLGRWMQVHTRLLFLRETLASAERLYNEGHILSASNALSTLSNRATDLAKEIEEKS